MLWRRVDLPPCTGSTSLLKYVSIFYAVDQLHQPQRKEGRRGGLTGAGIEEVRSLVTENRVASLRKIAPDSSSSLTTTWKILCCDLKFKFHRITSVQPLKGSPKQMMSVHKENWYYLPSAQSWSQTSWLSLLGCCPKRGLFSKTRNNWFSYWMC